jgi:hypothetical protein
MLHYNTMCMLESEKLSSIVEKSPVSRDVCLIGELSPHLLTPGACVCACVCVHVCAGGEAHIMKLSFCSKRVKIKSTIKYNTVV